MSGAQQVPTPNPVPVSDMVNKGSVPAADELKSLFSNDAKATLDQSLQHAIATNEPTVVSSNLQELSLSFAPPADESIEQSSQRLKQTSTPHHGEPGQSPEEAQEAGDDAVTNAEEPFECDHDRFHQETEGPAPTARLVKASDAARYSKADVVNILEGFVNLIKQDQQGNIDDFSSAAGDNAGVETVSVDDRTAEIDELRELLIEAQETIIQLLTDRVEDRAKIAQLEAELKLLPDFQRQTDRAIAQVIGSDDFRSELAKVKSELERLRIAKVRGELDHPESSWWTRLRKWFFGK